jgi:hypothetical protein
LERSFADAANNHHFRRARWRRLWRQQIQDYLIAAIQNVRILLANQNPKKSAAAALSSLILRAKMPTLLHTAESSALLNPTRTLCRLNNLNTVYSLMPPNKAFGQHAL